MYIIISESSCHGEYVEETDPAHTMTQVARNIADCHYEDLNQVIHVDVKNGTSEDVTERVMMLAFNLFNPWEKCEQDLAEMVNGSGYLGEMIAAWLEANMNARERFQSYFFPNLKPAQAA